MHRSAADGAPGHRWGAPCTTMGATLYASFVFVFTVAIVAVSMLGAQNASRHPKKRRKQDHHPSGPFGLDHAPPRERMTRLPAELCDTPAGPDGPRSRGMQCRGGDGSAT